MKNKIIQTANNAGITQIGIVKAEVFSDLGNILQNRKQVPMTTDNIDERINPFLIMPEVKSIIVCLFPYFSDNTPHNISKYAHGIDYHTVIKHKLACIVDLLAENGFKAEIHADNSNLNDRYLAYKAGLGFIGENGFIINPVYGTYTFIGYVLTDCALPPDKPVNMSCIKCRQCIKSCPGQALSDNHMFDAEKCLSYITQKKGELSEHEENLIKESGSIWGCDVCQDVCPHNKNIKPTDFKEFSENLIHQLCVDENMSNKEFRRTYGDRAFAWRGKSVLIRNINILKK